MIYNVSCLLNFVAKEEQEKGERGFDVFESLIRIGERNKGWGEESSPQ